MPWLSSETGFRMGNLKVTYVILNYKLRVFLLKSRGWELKKVFFSVELFRVV